MMYKLLSVMVAVSVNEVVQAGKTVGTANNQVILGILVVSLAVLVGFREWQQSRANRESTRRHDESLERMNGMHDELLERLDKERSSWEQERQSRISMLMTLVQDNTKAMERAALSQSAVAEATGTNTSAINALRDLIFELKTDQPARKRG